MRRETDEEHELELMVFAVIVDVVVDVIVIPDVGVDGVSDLDDSYDVDVVVLDV